MVTLIRCTFCSPIVFCLFVCLFVCFEEPHVDDYQKYYKYSGTPLIRPPSDRENVVIISG